MNKELPTQVDEACENTSNRKIPVIVKFTKNLRDISKQMTMWYMWKIFQFHKYFTVTYTKFTRLKKNTATVEDDTHTEYTLNEAY